MPEETQVVIVGAGPAGLTLGLCLAQYHINSIILEKEAEIVTDPRGVYLTGDSIRILSTLGLGADIAKIGHVVEETNFHKSTFCSKPFYVVKTGSDAMSQTLPNGILQMQPRLESSLRQQIERSKYCTLRTESEVVSQVESNPPTIAYRCKDGSHKQIKAEWLVGADGKVGVVRKHFLEKSAGIKQIEGVYRYAGTWVAANLKIQLPTPKSHPNFSLWNLGYTPEQVYDLFWPKGWHFCSPPGKPTASGRFGPHEERLWRHEFRQEDWNESMDAVDLLWDHLVPMITRDRDEEGKHFGHSVQFPRDCIEIVRCRPFRFVHKVVNMWFANRTILIGDAAHVFPPFAGQGIGSGLRDAHQLAWRLALLLKDTSMSETASTALLEAWAQERRKSVDHAALMSLMNGKLCNNQPTFWMLWMLRLFSYLNEIPPLREYLNPLAINEREGFTLVENGFLVRQKRGGSRMAQIVIRSHQQGPMLSDQLLLPKVGLIRLLVITEGQYAKDYAEAKEALEAASPNPALISSNSILLFSNTEPKQNCGIEVFWPASDWQSVCGAREGYNPSSFIDRLGNGTKFALVRPDFFVFACAKDVSDLKGCLRALQSWFA
ncbi:monooxygenase-like protein [Periconia macrospinosa]|uniref:Monooxygenase-like protein n=1 Tax=Periconia macrospinosa TaxID=97972 RepID=A0A2V1DZ80_9PLEO|nr:monooxygenase-like protein [Periconia macrospinosa]